MKITNAILPNIRLVGINVLLCLFGISFSAFAQEEDVNGKYKVGARVECDANHGTGEYKEGTVIEVVGAGDKSTCCRYQVAFDDDTAFMKKRGWLCTEKFIRLKGEKAPAETQNSTKTNTPKTTTERNADAAATNRTEAKYNSGDRVECQPVPKIGAYRKGTVVTILADGRYRVRFDDEPLYPEGIICSPEYMRPSGEAAPPPAECPFNKNYARVSDKAAPSAELFKSVIFEWQNSISNFYDFGLTFLSFKMGTAFKNRVYPGVNVRKDVDTAPVGATIYPIKVKELACKKDVTITLRSVTEIEYACYKSAYGEWVCKNGTPIKVERSSIPNK